MARRGEMSWEEWRAEQLRKAPASGGVQTPIAAGYGMTGPPGNTVSYAPAGPAYRRSGNQGLPAPTDLTAGLSPTSKYTWERPSQPDPWIDDVDMSSVWWSPFQPVWPYGPPWVSQPREWNYPVGYNLNYIPQRMQLMQMLRGMRASWGVLATIIATRQDQLLRIPWTIQRKDKPRAASVGVDEMKKFFKRPDGKLSYSQWTRKLTDDLLVLDAPAVYFARDRRGRPIHAEVLDGSTIFPLIDDAGRRPDSTVEMTEDGIRYLRRQPAFQQIIYGLPMIDLDESELMYVPMRPRSDLPIFGYPGTEQILVEASEAVTKTFYQLNFWREGTIPDLIVTVPKEWCYSEDTEVLTRKGWKKFTEVDIETDEFATRNKYRAFEWQRATGINLSEYDGDMMHLHSRSIDCLVNPPHRVLISRELHGGGRREEIMTAQQLFDYHNSRERIPVTSIWIEGKAIEDKKFWQETNRGAGRDFTMSGDDYCAFMGMWLAEGYVDKHTVHVTQSEKSKGFAKFRDLFTKLFGDATIRTRDGFAINNAPLARHLWNYKHASKKTIPTAIMEAVPRQISLFIDYYWLGDGGTNGINEVIYTSSRTMADQLQVLIQKIGMTATISEDDRRGRVVRFADGHEATTNHVSYVVHLSDTEVRKFAIEKQYYKGTIGCVSVPNGILYVRRNGKPCWSGNTPRQIAMFQAHFDALLSGNINLKSKVRFLPGDMKPFDIKNSSGESLWSQRDETLVRLACYAYSVSPAPFVKMLNRSTAQNAQQMAEEEGLWPLMAYWKDDIIDPIIEKFGYDDIEFTFLPKPEPDQEKAAKIHDMKIKNGEYSINEAREEDGLEPVEGGDAHLIYIGNAIVPLESAAAGDALPQSGGDMGDTPKPAVQDKKPALTPQNTPLRGPTRSTSTGVASSVSKVGAAELQDAIASAEGGLDNFSHLVLHNGNYPKGHVWIQGLNVSIENAPGSKRGEKDERGVKWQVKMPAAYGYIRGTIGADGDQVDCYIGPDPQSTMVWVIDQNRVSKKGKMKGFDEHKVMLCYSDLRAALKDYLLSHFEGHGHDQIAAITELSMQAFKRWLKDGELKDPIADQDVGEVVLKQKDLQKADTISSASGLLSYSQLRSPTRRRERRKLKRGPRWLQLRAQVPSPIV